MSNREIERVVVLPAGSPTVVALCGSTRFGTAFAKAQNDETIAGRIVLTIGSNTMSDDWLFASMNSADRRLLKAKLDVLHLFKIQLADEILVLDVGGYIGESTEREIEWGKSLNKSIRYWSQERGNA